MGKGSGVVAAPALLQAGPSAARIIQTGEGGVTQKSDVAFASLTEM